ncbi:MAG: class I SAM-dependent methyltransferase [Candidatus Eremiobacteraeota bacterium]|nr:class I SAM-dependent methyltransferase [Candidatus Eremiobacteraeota bacterium]
MCAFGFGRPKTLATPAEWFSNAYGTRLGMRSITFGEAIAVLCERTGADRTIVETGCVRERNDYSAGYSTVVFAQLVESYGGHVYTVDLSRRNMDLCRRITRRYAKHITYGVDDSIAYLSRWATTCAGRPIDLLYLDSWDYPIAEDDGSRAASQRHCLGELEAALPFLHARSLVLIDDGDLPGGGKPLLAKRRLSDLGWICLVDAYQTLWSAPGA